MGGIKSGLWGKCFSQQGKHRQNPLRVLAQNIPEEFIPPTFGELESTTLSHIPSSL
jgi:hypothetical protein